MELEWVEMLLDKEIEEGNIYGYVTDAREDVQLENYMEDQDVLEAVPIIQEKFHYVAILKNMYINEEHRGERIGSRLLDEFIGNATIKKAEAIVLVADTAEDNEFDLVKWYEGYGFEIIYGERDSFPVMVKKIEN